MSFLQSIFGNKTEKLVTELYGLYPSSNPKEAEFQREALADLHNGIIPTGYSLKGYLCKRGEKVIYSFNGVTHYCSAVRSEWVGRSAGTSVRIAKGFLIRTGANRGHSVQHTTMQEQGSGTLVLTNQGFSFVSQQKSARIPLARILSFQAGSGGANDFEFHLETDHTRNNTHKFFGINPLNVIFIESVLDLLANGPPPASPSPKPTPPPIEPVLPPALPAIEPVGPPPLPVVIDDIPDDVPHLKFTYTHGAGKKS